MMTGLAWAQGSQDFEGDTGLTGTYSDGSFIEDNIIWIYGYSRDQDEYPIDNKGLMLHNAKDSYLEATIPGGIGNFSFDYRKAYTSAADRELELIVNGAQVATTGAIRGESGEENTHYDSFSHDVNVAGAVTIKIKNIGTTATARQTVIDNIAWTGYDNGTTEPFLGVYPTSLSGFCYFEGEGPSSAKYFNVNAMYLTENTYITISDNFEISLSETGDYADELTLVQNQGQVAITNIYVRMKADLEGGIEQGTITVSSSGTDNKIVTLVGAVCRKHSESCYFVDFEDESETKPNFASGNVNLSGTDWNMTEALIDGTEASDFKIDTKSARLRGYGTSAMTMLEDKENGLGTLSFFYRRYGTDTQADWKVEHSGDQGTTWIQVGDSFTALASDEVQEFNEDVNVPGNVRIRIKRETESGTSVKRLNIDNILLSGYDGDAPEYDIKPNITVAIGNKTTATITGDSFVGANTVVVDPENLTSFPNAEFIPEVHGKWELFGSGEATIEISTTNGWFAWVVGGEWNTLEGPLTSGSFEIDLGSKDTTFEFMTGSGTNPTLPVELSSFTVALNPKGNPVVTWVTQTETGVNGFYIYRGESKNLDDAIMISNLIPATNSSLEHSYSFVDAELYETGVYYYWLNVSDLNGQESYHGPIKLSYNLENSDAPDMVYQTGFKSIYPNPFNPNANISFELAEDSEVLINVYNTRGQIVRSFAPFSHNAGYGSIIWDGKDDGGTYLASGIYLFRMTVGAENYNRKALMLK